MNKFINVSIESMILSVIDDINGKEIDIDKLDNMTGFIEEITDTINYWLMEYDHQLTMDLIKDCIISVSENSNILI